RLSRARTEPGVPRDDNAPLIPRRAATEPGVEADAADEPEEFDPVQIAAAAISRLRKRAKTDLAELRGHYHRHDIFVVLLAFVMIVIAGQIHVDLVTPPTMKFAHRGLTFEHSQAWLNPEPVPPASPRLLRDVSPQPPAKEDGLYHVEFTSTINPTARIEVLIDKKPAWSNIVTGLDLDRRTRWGELYKLDDSSVRDIEGHDWLRTAYRFAHAADKGDVPRVDLAVEYATKDKDQLYVITLYGSPGELARIEEVVAPSLRVATNVGLQIEPQTNRLSRKNYPNAVSRAFESTVMVVVADLVDGRLKPRGGGSGVIVGGDGSILTNYHVIHDKDGRLHDVFIIGRFAEPDHAPQLQCAGRPSRSKLQRDLDLALIKCDLDLDGRAWNPATSTGVWATLPESRRVDIVMGQRLWVLGYPDVGGGGLTLSQGEVGGWTGVDGAQGKDFIKTDASITHGNSGGPVVDDQGRLVGIASAFRTRITASGGVIESTQVGLVRPLAVASDLLAIAAAGWTPREGHTDVELTPSAVEAPAEGVRISTKIVDAANETPIGSALVMVLKPGMKSNDVDVNRLDDQVLSWGRSNTQGEVLLKQPVPVPGTYTVMVVARGYEPLIGKDALVLDAKTPPAFDPWGKIWLRSR
nr:trypsin-like peptidase domain-containing protein [Deltaproteobacteria bacterium]